jgi:hypothetical protein
VGHSRSTVLGCPADGGESPTQVPAAQAAVTGIGDALAEWGLISEGWLGVPLRLPYIALLGWSSLPPDRDSSRDLIIEPAGIMWLTPDVVARTDRPLEEIGSVEPVGSMVRFVAHDPDIRTIQLAVESVLPPVRLPPEN